MVVKINSHWQFLFGGKILCLQSVVQNFIVAPVGQLKANMTTIKSFVFHVCFSFATLLILFFCVSIQTNSLPAPSLVKVASV